MKNPVTSLKNLLLSLASEAQLRWQSQLLDSRMREHAIHHNILYSREPGTTPERHLAGCDVTVSLTSFGPRIREAATAIESVMEQTMLPNRIVLWLDKGLETMPEQIPQSLRRLERRGLEIRYTDDCGSATKLIPSLKAFPDDVIITVDDDVIYDYDMIDRLVSAHRRFPKVVCAGRIDRIMADKNGLRLIYDKADDLYLTSKPLMQPMALGVGGVLYPPHSLHEDVLDVETMRELAPRADDLWFKVMELRAGTPVYPVNEKNPAHDLMLSCAHYRQALALHTSNYLAGEDNKQLGRLVEKYPEILKYYK